MFLPISLVSGIFNVQGIIPYPVTTWTFIATIFGMNIFVWAITMSFLRWPQRWQVSALAETPPTPTKKTNQVDESIQSLESRYSTFDQFVGRGWRSNTADPERGGSFPP